MKRFLLGLLLFALVDGVGMAAGDTYWQQYVNYDIDVVLDTENKRLSGAETVVYYNQSPDTLYNFYMHLYPNAFHNKETQRSEEARKWYQPLPQGTRRSWINITEFRIEQGGGHTTKYYVEDTILKTSLPEPLMPGDSMQVHIEFTHNIRKHFGRAGYRNNQYDMAQWYPKVVVYDKNGWDNEPWHNVGEFYGEFGDFTVSIDLPFHYIVGASGIVVNGDPGWDDVQVDTAKSFSDWLDHYVGVKQTLEDFDKRRHVTFFAENVHDFAWSASPDFVYEYGVQEDTDVHVLFRYQGGRNWSDKVVHHATSAIEWLERKIGEYPYPQVTVIHGLLGGGMEYPMLIMDGFVDESLAVHEIGHIYFYGILANNEMQEAWLDEGFTTFQTQKYMVYHYGEDGRSLEEMNYNYPGYPGFFRRETKYEEVQNEVIDLQLSGNNEPIAQPAYEFGSDQSYDTNVYFKASLMLWMLEYVMGEELFWNGMREYYDTWKLKHVTEQNFRKIMQEHAGQDLESFFDAWLHNTGYVDYDLTDFEVSTPVNGTYESKVEFRRLGSYKMPLEIELRLENGETVRKRWMGEHTNGTLQFGTSVQPEKVVLDPDNKILDVNWLNNISGLKDHVVLPEYPGLEYHPRDEYVVRWYPAIWYNDVDGMKLGGHIHRSYAQDRRKFEMASWLGLKSLKYNYHVRFSDLLYQLSPNLRYSIDLMKIEGRQWNEVGIEKIWWRAFQLLPKSTVGFQFRNIALTEPGYLQQPWKAGTNNQVGLDIEHEFRGINWKSFIRTNLTSSNPLLGSDFRFNKAQLEVQLQAEEPGTVVFARFFGGTVFPGGKIPYQEKYSVSGGNAYDQFHYFYTRSSGSFFGRQDWINNVYLPGDGNVRGYYASERTIADRVIAATLEFHIHFYGPYDRSRPSLIFFGDAGRAGLNSEFDNTIDTYESLADFGVGFSIVRAPLYMRVDIPLWTSRSTDKNEEEEQFSPSILISFERQF